MFHSSNSRITDQQRGAYMKFYFLPSSIDSSSLLVLFYVHLFLLFICYPNWMLTSDLTLSWRRPISYRNQSIDLLCKSMDWFLYDIGLRHERVKRPSLYSQRRSIDDFVKWQLQKQSPEVFCKSDVLKNFAKFTGKRLCQSLFFNKVAGGYFWWLPPKFGVNICFLVLRFVKDIRT